MDTTRRKRTALLAFMQFIPGFHILHSLTTEKGHIFLSQISLLPLETSEQIWGFESNPEPSWIEMTF